MLNLASYSAGSNRNDVMAAEISNPRLNTVPGALPGGLCVQATQKARRETMPTRRPRVDPSEWARRRQEALEKARKTAGRRDRDRIQSSSTTSRHSRRPPTHGAMPVQVVAPQPMSMVKASCNSNTGWHLTTKQIISIISRSTRFALIVILRDTAGGEDVAGAAVEDPRQ